ncbi:hypothetical protein XFF6992_710109 [Xanthomonas citri pv. fuscans]|nr:hypothetical protein XFF6992_710109 [Xanthomonas citri pv. fuscans]
MSAAQQLYFLDFYQEPEVNE